MLENRTRQSNRRATWEKEFRIIVLCPATRLGEDAWIKISGRNQPGVVHSVFDHALNILLSDDYFLTVLSDKYLAVPFGISVSMEEGFSFKNWTEPGETVWIDENGMRLKSGVFDFTSNQQSFIFSSHLQPVTIHKFNPEVIALVQSWVKESSPKNGFCDLYDSLSFETLNEAAGVKDPVLFYAHGLLNKLKKSFLDEDTVKVAETFSEFVGLGSGLTPSGDDFILGFLAFFHFLKKAPFRSNFIREIRNKLMNSVPGRTSYISEVYLNYGLNGQFSEILTAFIQGLFTGDRKELMERTLRLINIGSTSGIDMIAGCLFAMHLSVFEMNLTKRHLKYA